MANNSYHYKGNSSLTWSDINGGSFVNETSSPANLTVTDGSSITVKNSVGSPQPVNVTVAAGANVTLDGIINTVSAPAGTTVNIAENATVNEIEGDATVNGDGDVSSLTVNSADALKAAIKNNSVKEIKLGTSFESPDSIHVDRDVTIDGGTNTITFTSTADGKKLAEGLHISKTATVKNLTVKAAAGFKDNLVEVMGAGAKAKLVDVTIEGSKQAAIYVGDSENMEEKEVLTLEGTITLTNNAWGGVGVKNGATVNAENANFIFTTQTPDYIYVDAELTEGTKTEFKSIIWDDSLNSNITVPRQLTKNYIYKMGSKKVVTSAGAVESAKATQIIWSLNQ